MFWLFEPAKPKGESSFIIFFWHGTTGIHNPYSLIYGDLIFIKHLVKKGFIVVYPVYQYGDSTISNIEEEVELGVGLVRRALEILPNLKVMRNEKNEILYGHTGISRGGGMSLNLANYNNYYTDLPPPQAVCAFVPRNIQDSYSNIPSSTKVLIIGAEDDPWNYTYIDAWERIRHIPRTNRNYIQANSDKHGVPNLLAHHCFACTGYLLDNPESINALDFYGSWKWATSLFNCASIGEECIYCLGNDSIITYMGKWSDNTLVKKATIIDQYPVDVDNGIIPEICIYPNPAGETLYIEYSGNEKINTIRIINSFGKTEFIKDFNNQRKIELNLSMLTPGVYFLHHNNNAYKIIIN